MGEAFETFLKLDLAKYEENEYLIVIRDKVVARGRELEQLLAEVRRKYPGETPLVVKVPSKEALILCLSSHTARKPPAH